jgi:hypothetical protein
VGEWIEIELVEEPTRQRRVEFDPAVPKPPRSPTDHDGRKRRLVAIGAGAAVVAVIGWAMSRSDADVSTEEPSATLDDSPDRSPSSELIVATTRPDGPATTRPRVSTTTGPPLVVTELGASILPTQSGLELVALTVLGDLLDIDLDTGQMITTDLSSGGGPATIVAGEGWTYFQRWDVSSSVLVPRGQLPEDITPTREMANGVYRGPEPDTMWVLQSDPATGRIMGLDLIGLDGESLGRSIDLQGWWPIQSDLAGGVFVQAGGGVYDVTEAGARRVADGEVVGVGVNHVLVRDCDEAMVCGLFVVDRQSGERRQVPVIRVDGLAQYWGWTGTDSASISPDGTAAILFGLDGGNSGAFLIGTDTGVDRELTSSNGGTFSVAWSDDSRYVVYTDSSKLKVHDRIAGETIEFDADVPGVVNIAQRP